MRCAETEPAAIRSGPHPPRRAARAIRWGLVACCLLAVGCGGAGERALGTAEATVAPTGDDAGLFPIASPVATPVPATPAAGFRSAGVATGAVVWTAGTDPETGAPRQPVAWFAPDAPAIVAAVAIERAPAGTRFSAEWRYNDAPMASLASAVTVDGDGAARWVSFAIDLPDGEPWPTGVYEVAIAVDDRPALRATVEVSEPGG